MFSLEFSSDNVKVLGNLAHFRGLIVPVYVYMLAMAYRGHMLTISAVLEIRKTRKFSNNGCLFLSRAWTLKISRL